MSRRLVLITLVVCVFILISGWITYGFWQTHQAFAHFQQLQFSSAAQAADRALPVARSLNNITFHQVPDLKVWQQGLEITGQVPTLITRVPAALTSTDGPPIDWGSLHQQATTLNETLNQTWLLRQLQPKKTESIIATLDAFEAVYQALLTGDKTILLVFQNSQELRATGGFIGSYALVKLSDGQLASLEVQDIYVPDGQFKGFIPAPPGVEEYLSSGQGLRLPDANWSPDFPTSAQTILSYFALGNESQIEGVGAINLELASGLLDIFGEVFVPDYQLTVTSENLAQVLRSGRENFFPGSIQKQHLLGSVVNQLKFQIAAATPTQQQQLFQILLTAIKNKYLQAYAHNTTLQNIILAAGLAGQVSPSGDFYFFPVESNVGINKANPGISRKVDLTLGESTSQISLIFTNTNLTSTEMATGSASPHYANYQRLLLKPEMQVVSITIDDQPIENWDESVITTTDGNQVKQVGWLVGVPAQTMLQTTVQLTHPPVHDHPKLSLQKQAGIPPIPYTVTALGETQHFELTEDTILEL